MARLTSTRYTLTGASTEDHFRAVWLKVSRVDGIGAIAFDREDDETAAMTIKHKADVELDRAAIVDAVREAGAFDVT